MLPSIHSLPKHTRLAGRALRISSIAGELARRTGDGIGRAIGVVGPHHHDVAQLGRACAGTLVVVPLNYCNEIVKRV